MFKFGFGDPAGAAQPEAAAEPALADGQQPPEDAIPAEEVLQSEGRPTGAQETVAISSNLSLIKGVVTNAQAAALLADDRVAVNDLIAGVYEGGFKTWEGGLDLARFLAARLARSSGSDGGGGGGGAEAELGPGSRVMELGCGSGLPGLVALWAGAEVHFQDYNRSVLTTLTTQNVAANLGAWATRRGAAAGAAGAAGAAAASSSGSGDAAPAPRFFSGSWDALPALLEARGLAGSYDAVLTAETIYSPEAQRSLLAAIKACLRPGAGLAYVASKSHYFGVGGGTAAFAALAAADGTFECSQAAVLDDGLSNRREILRLAPRRPAA